MKRIKNHLLALSALCLGIFSCNFGQKSPVEVHFQRFDEAIFTQKPTELLKNYTEFAPFYFEKIIKVGIPKDSISKHYFQKFKDTYQSPIYDSVRLVFKNMKLVEQQLGKALGNYKAIFPKDSLPQFYTHFSGFNQPIVTNGKIISVSLENYLGKSSYYDGLGIFKYLRTGMYPRNIAPDVIRLLLLQKITSQKATDNLLSTMLYKGKLLYILQQIFPERDIADLMNYSELQKKWCKNNEAMMWQFIIEQKHLFSSDYRTIRGYISPAPFTRGFPNESPGQTGGWLGYQIIKKYMENTNSSIAELLKNTNYQGILQQSNYNPNF